MGRRRGEWRSQGSVVLSGPGRKSAFVRWLTPLCLCNSLNLPPERHRTFAKSLHEGAEEARKLCNETRISRRGTTAAAAHTHTIKPIPKITTEGRGEILLWTGFVVISGRVNTTNRGRRRGELFWVLLSAIESLYTSRMDGQTDRLASIVKVEDASRIYHHKQRNWRSADIPWSVQNCVRLQGEGGKKGVTSFQTNLLKELTPCAPPNLILNLFSRRRTAVFQHRVECFS